MPKPRFSRRITEKATLEELQSENDYLAGVIADLEKRLPTDEELAYLRNRKMQDEHANWTIKLIKANAPWVLTIIGAVGSMIYWLLTHNISIGDKR